MVGGGGGEVGDGWSLKNCAFLWKNPDYALEFTRTQKVIRQRELLPVDAFTTLIDIRAYGVLSLSSPSCVATALESSWVITT